MNSKRGGVTKLIFRYALAGSNRPLKLQVNSDDVKTLSFPESGAWTIWKDLAANVSLKKGENIISLHTLDKSGPNIDHLQVLK